MAGLNKYWNQAVVTLACGLVLTWDFSHWLLSGGFIFSQKKCSVSRVMNHLWSLELSSGSKPPSITFYPNKSEGEKFHSYCSVNKDLNFSACQLLIITSNRLLYSCVCEHWFTDVSKPLTETEKIINMNLAFLNDVSVDKRPVNQSENELVSILCIFGFWWLTTCLFILQIVAFECEAFNDDRSAQGFLSCLDSHQ